jgi:hypothetical protein
LARCGTSSSTSPATDRFLDYSRAEGPFRDPRRTEITRHEAHSPVSSFQVRVFRKADGYLAWIDGIGTVEGRTLAETRREARQFIRTVLGGAFPDRPAIDPAGAREVWQFLVDVRLQKPVARRLRRETRRTPQTP